jgi:galacturonokinase
LLLHEVSKNKVPSLKAAKLRIISPETFNKYYEKLPGRFRKRAKYFFTEQERVEKGIKSWSKGDLVSFGKLMNESGDSSVYQYECGCPELITIYGTLKNT